MAPSTAGLKYEKVNNNANDSSTRDHTVVRSHTRLVVRVCTIFAILTVLLCVVSVLDLNSDHQSELEIRAKEEKAFLLQRQIEAQMGEIAELQQGIKAMQQRLKGRNTQQAAVVQQESTTDVLPETKTNTEEKEEAERLKVEQRKEKSLELDQQPKEPLKEAESTNKATGTPTTSRPTAATARAPTAPAQEGTSQQPQQQQHQSHSDDGDRRKKEEETAARQKAIEEEKIAREKTAAASAAAESKKPGLTAKEEEERNIKATLPMYTCFGKPKGFHTIAGIPSVYCDGENRAMLQHFNADKCQKETYGVAVELGEGGGGKYNCGFLRYDDVWVLAKFGQHVQLDADDSFIARSSTKEQQKHSNQNSSEGDTTSTSAAAAAVDPAVHALQSRRSWQRKDSPGGNAGIQWTLLQRTGAGADGTIQDAPKTSWNFTTNPNECALNSFFWPNMFHGCQRQSVHWVNIPHPPMRGDGSENTKTATTWLIMRDVTDSEADVSTVIDLVGRQKKVAAVKQAAVEFRCRPHIIFSTFKCDGLTSSCSDGRVNVEMATKLSMSLLDPTKVGFLAIPSDEVPLNHFQIPFLGGMYEYMYRKCPDARTYTYVNGDIVFTEGFVPTVEAVVKWKEAQEPQMSDFMISGPRVPVSWYPDWRVPLPEVTVKEGDPVDMQSLKRQRDVYMGVINTAGDSSVASTGGGGAVNVNDAGKELRRLSHTTNPRHILFEPCYSTDYFITTRHAINWSASPANDIVVGRNGFDMWMGDNVFRNPRVASIGSMPTLYAAHLIDAGPSNKASNSNWLKLDNQEDKGWNMDKVVDDNLRRHGHQGLPVYGMPCDDAVWRTEYTQTETSGGSGENGASTSTSSSSSGVIHVTSRASGDRHNISDEWQRNRVANWGRIYKPRVEATIFLFAHTFDILTRLFNMLVRDSNGYGPSDRVDLVIRLINITTTRQSTSTTSEGEPHQRNVSINDFAAMRIWATGELLQKALWPYGQIEVGERTVFVPSLSQAGEVSASSSDALSVWKLIFARPEIYGPSHYRGEITEVGLISESRLNVVFSDTTALGDSLSPSAAPPLLSSPFLLSSFDKGAATAEKSTKTPTDILPPNWYPAVQQAWSKGVAQTEADEKENGLRAWFGGVVVLLQDESTAKETANARQTPPSLVAPYVNQWQGRLDAARDAAAAVDASVESKRAVLNPFEMYRHGCVGVGRSSTECRLVSLALSSSTGAVTACQFLSSEESKSKAINCQE